MLSDIIAHLRDGGINVNDSRAEWLARINRVGKHIWSSSDHQLMEDVFNVEDRCFYFPSYLGEIRAVRINYTQVTTHNLYPKYHSMWPQNSLYLWQVLGKSPIFEDLAATPLTYRFKAIEGAARTVIVNGQTGTARHDSESISTQQEAVGSKLFSAVTSIIKPRTDSDLEIYQDDTLISIIPNGMTQALYEKIKIGDSVLGEPYTVSLSAEVAYKPPYVPFANDTDQLLDGRLDTVIALQVMAEATANTLGPEGRLAYLGAQASSYLEIPKQERQRSAEIAIDRGAPFMFGYGRRPEE